MSGRRAVCIEDIAEKVAMGPFGSNIKVSTFVDVGVPVISGQHLHDFRLTDRDYNFITKEHAEKLKNSNVFRGDVVFTHAGNIGQVSYIPEGSKYERYVLSQRQFYLRCNKKVANAAWLTYFFKSRDGQAKLLANASQVGVPSIARPASYLKTIELELPPLHEQDEVVRIIDAINDKIALNRKLNATLEAMAQALFQSWFVDFDPVKAKLAAVRCGRDPEQAAMAAIACKLVVPPGKPKAETLDAQLPSAEAIDAAVAALDKLSEAQRQSLKEKAAHFPANFQESELGLIPLGWEVGTLSDLSSLNEKSWSNKSHPEQVIYVDLANCKNGYILSVSQFDWKDAPSRARRIVTAGDTIFGTVRPSNRSFALVGESKMQLTASTGFAVLSPRENIFREFLYLSACGDENIDRLTHLADGAAYPAVRPDVVASYEIVIPTIESLKNFSDTTAEFFNQKQYNEHESRTLANLRDALLPKLLSGEISVSPN